MMSDEPASLSKSGLRRPAGDEKIGVIKLQKKCVGSPTHFFCSI